MTFQVNNFGTSAITYQISATVLTEEVSSGYLNNTAKLISGGLDVESVTVAAGEHKTVTVNLSLAESALAYLDQFDSGMYVEGYLTLTASGEPSLSLPFLSYYGSWSEPAMFSSGYYYDTEWQEKQNASLPNVIGYLDGNVIYPLGWNPYVEMDMADYLADRNAISPNADGVLDAVSIMLISLVRNADCIEYRLRYAGGGGLLQSYYSSVAKDYYTDGVFWMLGYGNKLAFNAWNGAELPPGTSDAVIEIYAEADFDAYDPGQSDANLWSVPVCVDTTAPTVSETKRALSWPRMKTIWRWWRCTMTKL